MSQIPVIFGSLFKIVLSKRDDNMDLATAAMATLYMVRGANFAVKHRLYCVKMSK